MEFVVFFCSRNTDEFVCNISLIAARINLELINNTDGDVTIEYIAVFNDILQFARMNPFQFPMTLKKGEMWLHND